jgi:hypothetical protein
MPLTIGDNINLQSLNLSIDGVELETVTTSLRAFVASATPSQLRQWIVSAPSQLSALTIGTLTPISATNLEIATLQLSQNTTLSNPTGTPYTGQRLEVIVIQGGSKTLAFDTAYKFSITIPKPTITTAAGKIDRMVFEYFAATGFWYLIELQQGF